MTISISPIFIYWRIVILFELKNCSEYFFSVIEPDFKYSTMLVIITRNSIRPLIPSISIYFTIVSQIIQPYILNLQVHFMVSSGLALKYHIR